MLACVCRPVSSSLPKGPSIGGSAAPQKRNATYYQQQQHHHQHNQVMNGGNGTVVTSEPRIATATIVRKKVNVHSTLFMHCFFLFTINLFRMLFRCGLYMLIDFLFFYITRN